MLPDGRCAGALGLDCGADGFVVGDVGRVFGALGFISLLRLGKSGLVCAGVSGRDGLFGFVTGISVFLSGCKVLLPGRLSIVVLLLPGLLSDAALLLPGRLLFKVLPGL